MKRLRQYIRQILLTEVAKRPPELPDDVFIEIKADGIFAEFQFVKKVGESEKYGPRYARTTPEKDGIYGAIQLYAVEEEIVGPCAGAFMISWVGATDGYGPMLYDLAMEYATANGGGLISDRGSVTPEARKVWDYYLNSRTDVVATQLDDANNQFTPEIEDNCDQTIADGPGFRYPRNPDSIDPNWPKSALSKVYRKTNDSTTKELEALGKLVEL